MLPGISTPPTGQVEAGSRCIPPCQVSCPVKEDIQRTNILLSLTPGDPEAASRWIKNIGDELFLKNPFFTVCGYVCGICETGCSYAETGGAIRRRLLKRFISERCLETLADFEPFVPGSLARIAIIGAGPAGLTAAFELAKRGYRPVVFEAGETPGGALRLIPGYRLPREVLDGTLSAITRIAGIELRLSSPFGSPGMDVAGIKTDGFAAIFIAAGAPVPRVLEYEGVRLHGQELPGVIYGHTFLYELAHGYIPVGYLKDKKVLVIGGGNLAFDVARSSRRLGGLPSVICLESELRGGKDALPADPQEVSAAMGEGVELVYSRGVAAINPESGRFRSISAPLCTKVFDEHGFNPHFDISDTIEIAGDILIIAVGQGSERRFLEDEGLLDSSGRVAFDPLTLQSLSAPELFLGGDMLRTGFMVDAMRDGFEAAESIDRFIRKSDLRIGRKIEYCSPGIPLRHEYVAGKGTLTRAAGQRLDFELYEDGFSPAEAIAEARRCLACGPCSSCEACIDAGIRQKIQGCDVDEERCSGCAICAAACPFGAVTVQMHGKNVTSATEQSLCRGCGLCVSSCPACARKLVGESSVKNDTNRSLPA